MCISKKSAGRESSAPELLVSGCADNRDETYIDDDDDDDGKEEGGGEEDEERGW